MELSVNYQNNKKRVVEIVRKYFGYTNETKDLFEKLYDDRESSVNVEYKDFMLENDGADFKVRRKLDETALGKIDSGFILFKLNFPSFVRFYNITYQNFRDWKIEINKNLFKLQKALVNYYSNIDNKVFYASDVMLERDVDMFRSHEYSETDINAKLKRIQERISERKLPGNNLELVISFDFADWLLCSSSESWTSCLNLNSNYGACFWHGLPALMGDPNRCYIYLTDGTKKSFHGIEVDRVIARAWGIMGEDDKIYLNKSYPTKNFSAQDVEYIFPEFHFGSIEELAHKGSMLSKNPIVPFWMPDNLSDFIYSDLSTPRRNGKIEFGNISGGHWVFKKLSSGDKDVISEHHFRYERGLSLLIEKDVDIIANGGHHTLKKCKICGSVSTNQKMTDDGYICNECYQKLPKCSYCGNRQEEKNMVEFETRLYCKSCFNSRFSECEICGKKALKEEFSGYDKCVCKTCYSRYYFKCGACSTQTRINRMKMLKNKIYCENCYGEKRREER